MTFMNLQFNIGDENAITSLVISETKHGEVRISGEQDSVIYVHYDAIELCVQSLVAIKDNIDKKARKANPQEAQSSSILPPFNFNTSEKLAALMGRKVELRNGSVHTIEFVCDDANALDGGEEVIGLDNKMWIFKDGTYYGDSSESPEDIVKVLPASN